MDTLKTSDSLAKTRRIRISRLKPLQFRPRSVVRECPADSALWEILDTKQMQGHKFERRYSFPNLVLDCFCPSAKLAVEIERSNHQSRRMEEGIRERLMEAHGLRVLRFPEEMVLERPQAVKNTILEELAQTSVGGLDND